MNQDTNLAVNAARRRLATEVLTDPFIPARARPASLQLQHWRDVDALERLLVPKRSVGTFIVHAIAASILGVLLLGVIAQQASAADVANQPTLTLDGAKSVVATAVSIAHSKNAPGAAVAVVDAGGNLLALERIDGTFAAAPTVSTGKARTAIYFKKPTRVFEDLVNKGRYAMLAVPEIAPFTPLMGGVPIEVNGNVIGAIGVSGAASAQQDDEIATAAAEAFAKSHASPKVSFVPREKVDEGFRSDANLITADTFRVNSSKRDGAGEAEVHLTETDIFYVLEGSATFVTGGEVVAARNTSATEIRGSELRNGEEHRIAKGDVITIPRGVPHWFKEVKTPFRYYVVKTSS